MEVISFKGYRYDPAVVGRAGDCIAPPYDVIDKDQQNTLYQRNDFNIVRIIKSKSRDTDNDRDNVYTRAADSLADFLAKKALMQDPTERMYTYCQDFSLNGQTYRRSGFIALGKLQAYGDRVKPHEQTLAGPKADRLKLLRATKCQIGQVFMLYSDPQKTIDAILAQTAKAEELLSHTDEQQVTHRLFAVSDPKDVSTIADTMRDKDIFIADGHHRYESGLNYYNESQNPAAAWQMMTFVNTANEGLFVLPTHRLIKDITDFSSTRLLEQLRNNFDVARLSFSDENQKRRRQQETVEALSVKMGTGNSAFGIYMNDGAFYVAALRDRGAMAQAAPEQSAPWRQLDVAVLHKLILEKYLGIDEAALSAQTHVEYIKDIGDATDRGVEQVDRGKGQALFFMNPTRIEDIKAVAQAGEKMPQKSTFFYPKIFSGLVVRVLE